MSERILEYFQTGPIAKERIDRDQGVIRGVKFLGVESRNPPPHNNSYPIEMRRASEKLLEGAQIYVNHPPRDQGEKTRDYQEKMGVARNIHESGEGLVGDWHFPPKHALADTVLWDAANNQAGLSFSINATAGKIRFDGGRKIVESLEALHSIDLVTRGATTTSLFESVLTMKKIKNRSIFEALCKKSDRPKVLKLLEDDYAPMLNAETEVADEGGDAFDHLCNAIGAAMKSGDWDMADKLYKAAKSTSAPEKKADAGADDTGADDAAETKESLRKRHAEETKRLQEVLVVLAENGLTPSKVLVKLLESTKTKAEMQAVIKEYLDDRGDAPLRPAQKPKSGLPQKGTRGIREGQIEVPETILANGTKAIAEWASN